MFGTRVEGRRAQNEGFRLDRPDRGRAKHGEDAAAHGGPPVARSARAKWSGIPLETFGIVGETTPNHHRVNARIPLAFQTTVNVPLTTLFDPPKWLKHTPWL